MEVIIGKNAGFCFGVKNAVEKTKEVLEKTDKEVYCLGELVHNEQVMSELINDGLKVIQDIHDAKNNTTVIIRAHGISKEIYEISKQKKINLIDLTCPKVLKIHEIAKEYVEKNFYIFLIAVKNHPEAIGTYSFSGENKYLIESSQDIQDAINSFSNSGLKDLCIIVQTTFMIESFELIVDEIKNKLEDDVNLEIKKTICNSTKIRQIETEDLSSKVNLIIVIGGKNSSNTKKLYEIADKYCKNALIIQTVSELDIEYVKKFEKIGIVAGTSTPKNNIDEIVNMLNRKKER